MVDVCRLVKPPNFFGPLDWKKTIQEHGFKNQLLGLKDQVEYFVRQQSRVDHKGNYNTGHMELARLRRLVKSRSVDDFEGGSGFTTNLFRIFFRTLSTSILCSAAATPSSIALLHIAARTLCHWCSVVNRYVPLVAKTMLRDELKYSTSSDQLMQFTVLDYTNRIMVYVIFCVEV